MSNSYIKAAFGISVSLAEADLLRRVVGAIKLIGDAETSIDALEAHYRALGDDFVERFPRTLDSPFDGLLDLFPDENHPILDFDVDFGTPLARHPSCAITESRQASSAMTYPFVGGLVAGREQPRRDDDRSRRELCGAQQSSAGRRARFHRQDPCGDQRHRERTRSAG
ncbi:hypothetical protein ACH0CP_13170 [Sphingomonas sp. 179-I 2A4 NHS]|uniref:hypothetical protein n=1 Tax=unclassified Sphingomonas TaxID=196159 RepID=UPI00387A6FEF